MYLAILTKQAWSVKALLSVAKTKSFLVGQFKAGNPEREDKVHLARSGSQSEDRIRFTLRACGTALIIKQVL